MLSLYACRPTAFVSCCVDDGTFAVAFSDRDGETILKTAQEVHDYIRGADWVWADQWSMFSYYCGSNGWTGETFDWRDVFGGPLKVTTFFRRMTWKGEEIALNEITRPYGV